MAKDKKVEIKFLLPLGSVVRLKNTDRKVMVTANFLGVFDKDKLANKAEDPIAMKDKNGKPMVFDYMGVLWPEGDINSKKKLFFQNDSIEEVYFYGYCNPKQKQFRNTLEEPKKWEEK